MPSEYRFESTPRFDRLFADLQKNIQERVHKSLKSLITNPTEGKRLHGPLSGLWSLRVGDYRIIYELKEQTIIFHAVRPRKTVYE